MFALIDCNNFFVSCERLFRPDLINLPVMVLSNNDGCVIARSNEVKNLGIPMGIAYFKVQAIAKQNNVQIFSSNYELYADISARIMQIIQTSWSDTEIYSIDEAFLDLSSLATDNLEKFCWNLQRKILKYIGIPVSIGIGNTKTLAKAANFIAKKILKIPVFNITHNREKWLAKVAIGEIWGVGRQWEKKLKSLGIIDALQLSKFDSAIIKKLFNVTLQKTALELRGYICLDLQVSQPKQSIVSSRSFGRLCTDYELIREAISYHCANAWKKLRVENFQTQYLSVFILSNSFRKDLPQYSNSIGFRLINATDDLRVIIKYATICLDKIFKSDIYYYKVGIMLGNFTSKQQQQLDLFNQPLEQENVQANKIMDVMDLINHKYGTRTLRLAAEGFQQSWGMKRNLKSPGYTTRWDEIPLVR